MYVCVLFSLFVYLFVYIFIIIIVVVVVVVVVVIITILKKICRRYYCMERKEGNVLLKTHSTHFILRLYGIGHMVKDHSDNERGTPMPPWATLSI